MPAAHSTTYISRPTLLETMTIRFADISQLLRVTDPRSGARLCEAQNIQSIRIPINRIGMLETYPPRHAARQIT